MPNVDLKMGALSALPSTKKAGAVYFAQDGSKNFGEIYYDNENGERIKISPKINKVECLDTTGGHLQLKLTFEDESYIQGTIPKATGNRSGLLSSDLQVITGPKYFNTPINFGMGDNTDEMTNISSMGLISEDNLNLGLGVDQVFIHTLENTPYVMLGVVEDSDMNQTAQSVMGFMPGLLWAVQMDEDTMLALEAGFGTITNNLAVENNISTDSLSATQIQANSITGSLSGNASTASKLQNSITINDTSFDGSTSITTEKWGAERVISISNTAGDTGTAIDGSAVASLIIPSTMIGFSSITSTNLLATNIGNSSDQISTIHTNSISLYQSNYTGATTLVRDAANIVDYTLHLPSASGRLIYHTKDTAIGSANIPVYISSAGQATICGAIDVAHGGTGCATLTQGAALIGNGTDAITTRDITNITTAGNIDSNDNLITANTLNNWKGTSNIVTVGTISSGTWQGTSIKVGYGGTGTATAPVQGGIIYGSSTSAYGCTNAGSSGQLLQSNGTAEPSWTTDDKGSAEKPVYLNKGVLTECSKNFDEYLPLTGGTITGTVIFNDPIKFNTTSYGVSLPNSGDNGQLFFVEDDGVLITTNYGENDPDSSTKGYGIEGALYFKILKES